MPLWLFAFLGTLALISALGVILQRNPVHCLLALVLTLLAIAALFIGEGAVVVGFLQAIVYVGAIMVIFLFVIWLLNLPIETGPSGHLALKFFGAIAAAALLAELWIFAAGSFTSPTAQAPGEGYGSMDRLAAALFGRYLVAFEVTSVLLLVAVVGAIALARRMPEHEAGTAAGSSSAPRRSSGS